MTSWRGTRCDGCSRRGPWAGSGRMLT
jgi:hypothetical protein